MQNVPPDPPAPPLPPPPGTGPTVGYLESSPWTSGRVFWLLAAWLLGGAVGGLIAFALGFDPTEEPVGLAITVLSQSAAAIWVVKIVSRRHGAGDLRRDVGLTVRARDAVGIGWGIGLQLAVAVLVTPLVQRVSDDFDTQQQVADLAEATTDVGGRLILVVMFVLVAPFIEEVIFRGAMMGWLARHLPSGWAVTLSAAAFAAVHLADPNARLAVPSLFAIGLGLGFVARRRGNIGIAIFMHAGVNLLGAVVLIWGSDIAEYLERTSDELQSVGALFGLW